jgi:hypothetical protein
MGHFENLQSCVAAYFDSTEVVNFIVSNYRDGRLFFFDKEDKRNVIDNVQGTNNTIKFQSMVAHLLHLGYELVIAPSNCTYIIPWLYALVMTKTTVDPSKMALP